MMDENTFSMPEGLPAQFTDRDDGFKRLCSLLQIQNRQMQQAIINSDVVKHALRSLKVPVGKLKTAEKLRKLLTAFYRQPSFRRNIWQHSLKREPNRSSHPVPSFEYQALKAYDPEIKKRDLNKVSLDEALSDFPDDGKLVTDATEWQRVALSVWPELWQDICQWETLDSTRRDSVAPAVFAVATVVDDTRFLKWASSKVQTLAEEFAFVCVVESATTKATNSTMEFDDAMERWNDTCIVVADLASKMAKDVSGLEHFSEFRRRVEVLDDLHKSVSAVIQERFPHNLIKRVTTVVETLASDHEALWLHTVIKKINALWKLTYLSAVDVDVKKLQVDVERAVEELKQPILDWQAVEAEKRILQEKLGEIGNAVENDLGSQLSVDAREEKLHRQLAAASARARQLKLDTLSVATPEGVDFDPSRNYEQEWVAKTTENVPQEVLPELAKSPDDGVSPKTSNQQDDKKARIVADTSADGRNGDSLRKGEIGTEPSRGVSAIEEDLLHAGKEVEENEALAESSDSTRSASGDQIETKETKPVETQVRSKEEQPDHELLSSDNKANSVLWHSMEKRPGIAYHIARLLSQQRSSAPALPPADLVAALMLADCVQYDDDKIAVVLKKHFGRIDPASLSCEDPPIRDCFNLLLFCATVRPALLAPSTGAVSLLRRVNTPNLSPVYNFAVAIANHSARLQQIQLDASLFKAMISQTDWSEKLGELRARVRDWLGKAKGQRIIFRPAHRVWTHWLSKSGPLEKLAKLIAESDSNERQEVKKWCERLGNQKSFNDLVREADREIRGRKRGIIEGRALPQLRHHVQPLLGLAGEWLRLMDAKVDSKGFVEQNFESLRSTIHRMGELALSSIDEATKTASSEPYRVALNCASKSIAAIRGLFEENIASDSQYFNKPDTILSRDLLYVSDVNIDMQWQPSADTEANNMLSMLTSMDKHADTMRSAFDARFQRGDLTGACLVFSVIEAKAEANTDIDQCRTLLEAELQRNRVALNTKLIDLRNVIEQAFCFGQLDEEIAADVRARLVSVDTRLDGGDVPDLVMRLHAISTAKIDLEEIRQSISNYRDKGRTATQNKLEQLSEGCNADVRTRIERSIARGDLLTANELMSRIESGQALDPLRETDADDSFRKFISTVEEIEQSIDRPDGPKPDAIVKAAANRESVAGVSFEDMSESEAEQAALILEAWYELTRAKRFDRQQVDNLLSLLGWRAKKMSLIEKSKDWAKVALETETLQDRTRCPVRQFGSEARGRYRFLLSWGVSALETITQCIGSEQDAATIVFHFGRLGSDRQQLRSWAILQHRLFLVVDETLMLFLSALHAGRLSALFHCSLPFTDVDPYVTTAGLVPPELFFGRARERQRIMDPFGACFIYGGRQLGKTALLRSVEREFHRPEKRQIAKWIDLKAREIGHAKRPGEIWPLLWREMRQFEVLKGRHPHNEPNPENPKHIDALISSIEQWINEHKQRRLLLLLDEADAFLEIDARKDYRESTRLKDLMDRTERRLKVVFAGLHNVLRMTERANHPLAHLGDPINVGPLLSNGEWIEAQKLVREPLRAVGYRFEPKDLSTHILAQTNYYPSLIQLYGTEIVQRLGDSGKPVPYEVANVDIVSAYRSRALQNAIRERFLLTLQLDQRYEVITYALTFELLGIEHDLGRGLKRREIAECARAWWPEGFRDDDRQFNVLLQEMEGLGVLRSTENGRCYTLRNPNVFRLLGKRSDIYRVLEKKRETPKRFEPSSFHARYPGDENSTRRGPLTYEQESMLRERSGVVVITGCDASEVDHLKHFLAKRIEKASFQELSGFANAEEFQQGLRSVQPHPTNVTANVTTVVLIPQTEEWDAKWLVAANSTLRKKKSGSWIKLVFVADHGRLWQVMTGSDTKLDDVEWIGIKPWDEIFLRHWLGENNLPHDRSHIEELMMVSGGWPTILYKFIKLKQTAWEGRIKKLSNLLLQDVKKLRSSFGIAPEVKSELNMLLRHGPIRSETNEDIVTIADLEIADASALERRMAWGELLGLVSRSEGVWVFNPLVEQLLRNGTE